MNHFKTKNNKLEKLRGIFFQLGLIIAGGLTLVAFEWTSSYVVVPPNCRPPIAEGGDDFPPITFQPDPIKPKIKITQPITFNPDVIEVVDNNVTDIDPTDIDNSDLLDFNPDEWAPPVEKVDPPKIFTIVEKMPEFIGGEKALMKFLGSNINYPYKAKELGISGTVYVNFVINKKGAIKNVNVLRGVSPQLDKEAIRVVEMMPDWKPGKQRGKAVEVSYNLPINFVLIK